MFKQFQMVFVFTVVISTIAISQDAIKNYPGIPIVTYGYDISNYNNPTYYQQMQEAGIFALQVSNMTESKYGLISNTNLKIIPDQTQGVTYDFVERYSEGRYTVWEAEGTNPADGDATLYFKGSIGEKVQNSVRTKTGLGQVNETLIYGPFYKQENYYHMVEQSLEINYTADFQLKKEDIGQIPPQPNDTICILQVTASHLGGPWFFDSVIVIEESVIRYGDLTNTFRSFNIEYNLTFVPDSFLTKMRGNQNDFVREFTDYIEFKVIFKGNTNQVRLYVDKIIISDLRGRFITDPATQPIAEQQIYDQISEQTNYKNRIVGWMGLDEPGSIDSFEPIKIIHELVNSKSNGKHGLWITFGGSWSGRWDNWANLFGSYKLSMFEEFYKRVKKGNIWCSQYLFDIPYPNTAYDYQARNISCLVDSNYKHFQNKENVYWGAAIQTGKVFQNEPRIDMREIDGTDFFYYVNLALLYGAKVITPWLYFGYSPDATGLVNAPTYALTDKYYALKNVIAPRLQSLFGITLKTAVTDTQFAGLNAVDAADLQGGYFGMNGYDKLEKINSIGNIESPICEIELGFFHNIADVEKKYFMALNRYNSNKNRLVFSLRNLNENNNWELRDYVEDSRMTLNAAYTGTAIFYDTITAGDARLYSILPVVKYGGNLIADETISSPTTLHEDMTIENGATLYVNGEYYAYADITIEQGGSLVVLPGSSLYFYEGASLINKGNLVANGTAQDSILISFGWPNAEMNNGIKLERSSTTNELTYCKITNAYHGIEIDSVTPTIQYNRIYGNYDGHVFTKLRL